MALTSEEIKKVNNLYTENDRLKAENASLKNKLAQLESLESALSAKMDKVLEKLEK